MSSLLLSAQERVPGLGQEHFPSFSGQGSSVALCPNLSLLRFEDVDMPQPVLLQEKWQGRRGRKGRIWYNLEL